ncbi:hypothetical protein Dimus_015161 [Dionaea muscipula]
MWNWIVGGSLISFDLADQIFLKTPIHESWKEQATATLLQTNEVESKPRVMCVCRPSAPGDVYNTEIWELVEYGPSGCWSKQIVIGFPGRPLGYWQGEEALILPRIERRENFKSIVGPMRTYNSITKELKPTGFMHALDLYVDGCGYIESLVSVKELCSIDS